MTGSRFLRLCLVLLAAGRVLSYMDEGESVEATMTERNLRSRIVGGTKADPKRHPYFTQLRITFYDYWSDTYPAYNCGGTLIGKDVVLTAAHCLTSENSWEELYSVDTWVNATSIYYSPYEYPGTGRVYSIHPSYDSSTIAHDIALLYLDTGVTGVTLAKINKSMSTPAAGKAVTAIGLGLLKRPDEVKATYLMQVSMNTLVGSSCSNLYGSTYFKTANQICAGSTKNICQGDSGGPLLLKGTTASKDSVAGIMSYSYSEACGTKPSGFTRVSKYARWIETDICDYSYYPPSTCP